MKSLPLFRHMTNNTKKDNASKKIELKVNNMFQNSHISFNCNGASSQRDKIIGYCKLHNKTFSQMIMTALKGDIKCTECNKNTQKHFTYEEWQKRVQEKNKNTILFEKFKFQTSGIPSILICRLCNKEYSKTLRQAHDNYACRQCSLDWHTKPNTIMDCDTFIKKANLKFNSVFKYDKITWIDYYSDMDIYYKDKKYTMRPIRHMHSKFGCVSQYEKDLNESNIQADILIRMKIFTDLGYDCKIVSTGQRSIANSIIKGTCPNGHTTTKELISWEKLTQGCSICSKSNYIRTKEETLGRLEKSRPDFTFNATNYRVSKDKIEGICSNGHKSSKPLLEWEKYPCAKCIKWQSAFELDIIEKIKLYLPDIMILDRHKIDGKEADIYFPDCNFAIEAHGIYWHSEANNHQKKYDAKTTNHRDKYLHFKKHNIRLIQIYENEWYINQDKIIKLILSVLQPQTYIGARNTICKEITTKEANNFYNQHHLQGATRALVSYGLFEKNNPEILIASMSFSKGNAIRQGNQWELCRFAHSKKIIGGASKLFKHFLTRINPTEPIISFSDNRWFYGNMYKQLGFLENETNSNRPDYQYTTSKIKDKLIPKNKLRRSNINQMLKTFNIVDSYDCKTDERTESEMAKVLKLYKIYDAGKTRWEYQK